MKGRECRAGGAGQGGQGRECSRAGSERQGVQGRECRAEGPTRKVCCSSLGTQSAPMAARLAKV